MKIGRGNGKTKHHVPESSSEGCARCGASEAHTACPLCNGRGCISSREIAERLGMRELLDAAELTTDAVIKAVDKRVLDSFEAARKLERERGDQTLAAERKNMKEIERDLREEIRAKGDVVDDLKRQHAEAQSRAKQAEDVLAKRRLQPASVGRLAEREFAAFVGGQSDFRVSPKLSKNGDYEVWVRVDMGDGTLREIAEPILVDVKRESAALQEVAITKLIRDCKARHRLVGAVVADRLEEVAEIFGTPRVRVVEGITLLLTSVDAFVNDVRLLGPYLKSLVDAQISGNVPLMVALVGKLSELAQIVTEVEERTDAVAGTLEKQADELRGTVCASLCARIRDLVLEAEQRIVEVSKRQPNEDAEVLPVQAVG